MTLNPSESLKCPRCRKVHPIGQSQCNPEDLKAVPAFKSKRKRGMQTSPMHPPTPTPERGDVHCVKDYADKLVTVLTFLSDGQWHWRKDVARATGIDERTLRLIGNESGDIISNSTQGYKSAATATDDEIRHAQNDLRHRAQMMIERADKLNKWLPDGDDDGTEPLPFVEA